MKTKQPRFSGGFTLIEILLVIGLLSIVLTTIISFALTVSEQNLKRLLIHSTSQEGRAITERIEYVIRNAESVDSVAVDRIELGKVGASGTMAIFLRDERMFLDDGTGEVALSSTDIRVTSLQFEDYSLSSNRSDGIGYQIVFEPDRGVSGGESVFQTSMLFRGAADTRSSHLPE